MTTQRKIRVGFLGGGGILGAHMTGYPKLADRCEVAVVAEASPARDETIRKLVGAHVPIVRDSRTTCTCRLPSMRPRPGSTSWSRKSWLATCGSATA